MVWMSKINVLYLAERSAPCSIRYSVILVAVSTLPTPLAPDFTAYMIRVMSVKESLKIKPTILKETVA
jgi:hypothetical protein